MQGGDAMNALAALAGLRSRNFIEGGEFQRMIEEV
jgi:hypothetical protein